MLCVSKEYGQGVRLKFINSNEQNQGKNRAPLRRIFDLKRTAVQPYKSVNDRKSETCSFFRFLCNRRTSLERPQYSINIFLGYSGSGIRNSYPHRFIVCDRSNCNATVSRGELNRIANQI